MPGGGDTTCQCARGEHSGGKSGRPVLCGWIDRDKACPRSATRSDWAGTHAPLIDRASMVPSCAVRIESWGNTFCADADAAMATKARERIMVGKCGQKFEKPFENDEIGELLQWRVSESYFSPNIDGIRLESEFEVVACTPRALHELSLLPPLPTPTHQPPSLPPTQTAAIEAQRSV